MKTVLSLSQRFLFLLAFEALLISDHRKAGAVCLRLVVCVFTCLPGQMVFVWAASDKACINLVKIALAGGAAGGSW